MAMDLNAAIDEVVGALADPEELLDSEPEPDLEDSEEPELELDTDDDELDDLDGDDPDEEGDGPDEDGEELDEVDEGDGEAIEVSEDATIRLPDGTEVPVKEAALRQADYTRKTQELAEQRREFETERDQFAAERQELETVHEQMRTWLEEKTSDPVGWAREIVEETPNPTQTIAQAIMDLAQAGKLDRGFIEQFGIDAPDGAVQQAAQRGSEDERLARIERQLEEQRQAEQQAAQRRERVQQMFTQWDDMKLRKGLQFDSPDAEHDARRETLKFAVENGLMDRLDIAHDALRARAGSDPSPTTTNSGANKASAKKKRATKAMSKRSSGSSRKPPQKKAKSIQGAAELALDEFLAG